MNKGIINKDMLRTYLAMDSRMIKIAIYLDRSSVDEKYEDKLSDYEWIIIKEYVRQLYEDSINQVLRNHIGDVFSAIIRVGLPGEEHVVE